MIVSGLLILVSVLLSNHHYFYFSERIISIFKNLPLSTTIYHTPVTKTCPWAEHGSSSLFFPHMFPKYMPSSSCSTPAQVPHAHLCFPFRISSWPQQIASNIWTFPLTVAPDFSYTKNKNYFFSWSCVGWLVLLLVSRGFTYVAAFSWKDVWTGKSQTFSFIAGSICCL